MDSLLQKVFGLGKKNEHGKGKEHRKGSNKLIGSPVDKRRLNDGSARSTLSFEHNNSSPAIRYTLDDRDLELQKKRVKKCGKHKFFKISTRHGKHKTGQGEPIPTVAKHRPSLVLIARQSPCFYADGDCKHAGERTFDKYIPVENFDLPVYRLSKLDRHFPLCWFDLQSWYRETRARQIEKEKEARRRSIRSSVSDTAVIQKDNSAIRQESENDLKTEFSGLVKTIQELTEDERFGLCLNETYCKVASSNTNHFILELFVQLPDNNDFSLCHLKTEMIVHCFQKFFFPVVDIHVMWVHDLKNQALRVCSVRGLRRHLPPQPAEMDPLTTSFLGKSFNEMLALIIASPDAAVILKHGDLCFLQTLAEITEISITNVVVLEQVRKSAQLAIIQEIS